MFLPSVSTEIILHPICAICLNKHSPLSNENISTPREAVFSFCNEINVFPSQFKIIATRDTFIIIFAEKECVRNNLKTITKNRFSHTCIHFILLNTSTNTLNDLYKERWKSRTTGRDMFDLVSWWRDCCDGKVSLQLDDANAFHYTAFLLFSYATNRGNDNSATGWGKLRCCIAIVAQRVIDLNLRA